MSTEKNEQLLAVAQEALLGDAQIGVKELNAALGSAMTKDVDYADLYLQRINEFCWSLEDGVVNDVSASLEQGFGLRVLSGEKTGFAYSDEITKAALMGAASSAGQIVGSGESISMPACRKVPTRALYPAADPLAASTDPEKVAFLHEINAFARSLDNRIEKVSVQLSSRHEVVLILNSLGELVADVRPLLTLFVRAIAVDKGRREQGSAGGGGRDHYAAIFSDGLGFKLAEKAVRQAILNLSAELAPAGQMPVVLGAGWPGILLHEAVGHGLEADSNRKGTSVFSGRVGEKIASSLCTVVDDGTIAGRRGSLSVDDEGVEAQRTELIKDGVLVGYMQDRHNARLMGEQPTGNGRRESYAHMPIPRMTNTYMLAGESDPADIIASVDEGVYAVDFSGGQVDTTSGKFVFCMNEAYRIEKGKIGAPLKGATLIGSGSDVLHQVSMLGNDLQLDGGTGTCGKAGQSVPVGVGQPTLLIDRITVGGNK